MVRSLSQTVINMLEGLRKANSTVVACLFYPTALDTLVNGKVTNGTDKMIEFVSTESKATEI